MRILIFGATGMIGQSLLITALQSAEINEVVVIVRKEVPQKHPKLKVIRHADLFNLGTLHDQLHGFDACYFCIGVSAVGMKKKEYEKLTYDLTMYIAREVFRQSPDAHFLYISGKGTDSTEEKGAHWARIKGKTENDLLKLGFKNAYMLRPGYIQPMPGVKSRVGWYNALYALVSWLYPLLEWMMPNDVIRASELSGVMLYLGNHDLQKNKLESRDLKQTFKQLNS